MIRILALLLPYPAIGLGLFVFQNGWIAIGFYHIGMLSFLIADRRRPPFRQLFTGWNKIWSGLLPFSAMSGLLIYLLWPFMQQFNLDSRLVRYGLTGESWRIFMLYYILFNPPLEEYYWRGYLGHPADRVRPEDFAFAGYHFFTMICFVQWHWGLISFVILTFTAWLWRQTVRRTGGILIPMLAHFAADVSIIWVVNMLR